MRAETLARDQHPVSETRRGAGSAGPELPAAAPVLEGPDGATLARRLGGCPCPRDR